MSVDFPKPVWPAHVGGHVNDVGLFVQPPWAVAVILEEARTDGDHVELEATLQELVLDLRGDTVETDIRRGANLFSGGLRHGVLKERTGMGRR